MSRDFLPALRLFFFFLELYPLWESSGKRCPPNPAHLNEIPHKRTVAMPVKLGTYPRFSAATFKEGYGKNNRITKETPDGSFITAG
ncbi:MAG: hypothetical protein LBU25_10120 [Treponema sp.]|jgi:hypothetical protein|nr:hypothetical protein [Treponema sp.]